VAVKARVHSFLLASFSTTTCHVPLFQNACDDDSFRPRFRYARKFGAFGVALLVTVDDVKEVAWHRRSPAAQR
jgi:hypothetical protein